MPSSRPDLKAPAAIVLVIAVILTALFFAPPLIPLPPYDRNKDIVDILKHSARTPPLTSTDLFRFREINRDDIVPPSDIGQAEILLGQIEGLWAELREIAKEKGFRREGFAPHTRLGDWRRRLDALAADRPPQTIVGSDLHKLPDKLAAVGIDYATNPLLHEKDSVIEEWFVHYYLPVTQAAVRSPESELNSKE